MEKYQNFILNTKYFTWSGDLANYIILEEQPEYEISHDGIVYKLRGFCIICTSDNDYLLLGTEDNGRVKMDCMKIKNNQLALITDENEWMQCNEYVLEVSKYLRNEYYG